MWAWGKEKGIFVQKLDRTHIYILKVLLFVFEKKRWSWPFGMFNSHLCHVSRCIGNIFLAVTAISSKQRSCLCLLAVDYAKRAFEVFSFLLSTLQGTQDGQELGPGPSGSRVWSKAGPRALRQDLLGLRFSSQELKMNENSGSEFVNVAYLLPSKSTAMPGCIAWHLLLTSDMQRTDTVTFISSLKLRAKL